MSHSAFSSKPSDDASPQAWHQLYLAPALAGVTVLVALIGLSHETLWQSEKRWQQPARIANSSGEVWGGALNEAGTEKVQAGQKTAFAEGTEAELDELLISRSRQEGKLNAFKTREESQELAATEPVPSPPPLLQDVDNDRIRRFAELSGDRSSNLAAPAEERLEQPLDAEGPGSNIPARSASVMKGDVAQTGSARPDSAIVFQPAEGYWANTYIPGDPEIRLLNARLAQWDRSWLDGLADLERDVRPVAQPFDAPDDNALSLSLMADVSSVAATDEAGIGTRTRLQVGIQGIEHRRGLRPAMNVGLVVDLPDDAPDELRIATRALLDAMLQSKQAGDRFSLLLAGSGLVVEADDFRFGSLQLAKQHILGQSEAASGAALSLGDALEQAGRMVAESDDPSRPLGSSSVMLISAGALPDIDRLVEVAHAQAREGVTLSVFPLGNQPANQKVEQLVLAGLGNRRILETPGQARQLVEEELHASSRAVARAARLSIRLSPGVHLIDVIGSERLDEPSAERVREIENSMDRRLSANLGIATDRGSDEDGIQIVIPSIFSGDSVTVLLDVVVEDPGPIADVSLRYKDLVFLRNGILQGHLELPGGESQPGPAQRLVLKNRLSLQFSDAVEQAAESLGRNDPAAARAELSAMRNTIDQFRRSQAAWLDDPELIRDQMVLDRYLEALALPAAGAHQSGLTDSLRYAAWAKTHRPLEEWNL